MKHQTKAFMIEERMHMVNRSIAFTMFALAFVVDLVAILNYLGIYDAIEPSYMTVCLIIVQIAAVIAWSAGIRNRQLFGQPVHIIMIIDTLSVTFILSVLLNTYVTLILMLPIILVTSYYDEKSYQIAFVGTSLICIISPFAAMCLNTYSLDYFIGFVETAMGIHLISDGVTDKSPALRFGSTYLYMILPQLLAINVYGAFVHKLIRFGRSSIEKQAELNNLLMTDELTGLWNKSYFLFAAQNLLKEKNGTPYYMIMVNIRSFRLFNQIFGRTRGNEFIKALSELVKRMAAEGLAARYENDRMVMLIPQKAYNESILRRNLSECAARFRSNNQRFLLNVAIAAVNENNADPEELCDDLVGTFKRMRNDFSSGIVWYSEEQKRRFREEQFMLSSLQTALDENQFIIYLQPQIDANGNCHGAEVLSRWNHPEKGIITPDSYIALCENNNLVTKIDQVIWEKALQVMERWSKEQRKSCYLSLNISPIDIYNIDVEVKLWQLCQKYHVSPRNVHIEFTENTAIRSMELLRSLIRRLKQRGFLIELDDFGNGYASLNELREIDVDIVKLDYSFLNASDNQEKSDTIFEAMISMLQKLSLGIVVEGVENEEQLQKCQNYGIQLMQGFYFSRPVPVNEFEDRYL